MVGVGLFPADLQPVNGLRLQKVLAESLAVDEEGNEATGNCRQDGQDAASAQAEPQSPLLWDSSEGRKVTAASRGSPGQR